MSTYGIRKLPVIDDDQVVGIVTATDIVNRFAHATDDEMKRMFHHELAKIYTWKLGLLSKVIITIENHNVA